MKVIDNFITKEYVDYLEQVICGYDFDWHYSPSTVDMNDLKPNTFFDSNTVDSFQFCHLAVAYQQPPSKYWPMIAPLLFHMAASQGFKIDELWRCKINLTMPQSNIPKYSYYPPHFDTYIEDEAKIITALYYVNDSDGDTLFFETPKTNRVEELKIIDRVTPKKGTFVYFDNNTLHGGQLPVDSKTRCVINFNFKQ